MLMPIEQTEQAGALGQLGEQRFVIVFYPLIEGAVAYPFKGKQQGDSNHFRRIQFRLSMFVVFLLLIVVMSLTFQILHLLQTVNT